MKRLLSEIAALFGKSNYKTAVKLSFWSPFVAFATMASSLALKERWEIDNRWLMGISEGLFGLFILAGFALGVTAIVQMRRQRRRDGSFRALIGVSLDAVFICLACLALANHFKEQRLDVSQLEILKLKAESGEGLKEALIRNAKRQAAFEKVASQKSNGLSHLAGPAIDFLRNEQTVLSNYYIAAKALTKLRVLNTADITNQSGLEIRRTLVLKFMDANNGVSNYYHTVWSEFHTMAIKGGVPEATVEKQIESLSAKMNKMSQLPDIWKDNDRWARDELRALDLLGSNWQSWSYDGALRKTVFKDENVRTEFNQIVAEINTVDKERKQLQQQLLQETQKNPPR